VTANVVIEYAGHEENYSVLNIFSASRAADSLIAN